MAISIPSGDSISCRGTFDISSGTLSLKDDQIPKSKLTQQDLVELQIPFTNLRVWDNLASLLPGTAATDDLAIVTGTFGTGAPTVRTSDSQSISVTQYARFQLPISNDYVLGETMQIRVRGGMITTIADTSATVDLEVYVNSGDGAVGSDLCTTSATTINSLTKANVDFSITTSGLAAGDILDCRLTIAIVDSATGTVVIGELSKLSLLRDIR